MKTRNEIEKEIATTEELLTNLKAKLVENSKQVDKYNKKLENLKKLNPGDEVRLNKTCRKWRGKHGFEMNQIGGFLKTVEDALSYVGYKLIEVGKYKATHIEYRSDVGDGPGGKVRVSYPGFNIPDDIKYYDIKDLILKDK